MSPTIESFMIPKSRQVLPGREKVAEDYFRRAYDRCHVADGQIGQGKYIDAIRGCVEVVKLATLGSMIRSGMSLNVAIMLDESPQWAERHHPMVEMLALMNKPCPFHEMPLGAVVPSQYFASNDAKIALQYAADMLRVFAPEYSPSPARNIDHELPTLTPPGGESGSAHV